MLLGLKDPDAPLQMPVVVGPDTKPESTAVALFLHAVKFGPAFTVGAFVKLIITLSTVCLQLPLLVDVKVKLTVPAAISDALGLYKEFKVVLFGVNVPVPPLQMPVVVGPDTTPESADMELFLQTD